MTRDPGSEGDPELSHELLSRLEQRLDRASQAAERLIAEAATAGFAARPEQAAHGSDQPGAGAQAHDASGAGRPAVAPPASGWQRRDRDRSEREGPLFGDRRGSGPLGSGELDLLLHVLGSMRDRIPGELQDRLAEALRELLLALRALIDWYLERSGGRQDEPPDVQDIPIL